ncbi:hypothetical protein ACFQ0X_37275 [Streptomyces rectiviolaceus]|uniref:hypothetical protein n=1 Tax=Streptomyces rectiviolaceus TaxID=332591 RepID=UPI00363482A1
MLPVQLVDRLGDWGRIVCANGWSTWVDGRLLIAVPPDPPAAGHPLTHTADPGPLLARTEDALGRYRRATEELAAGRTDGESFRSQTRGLRVGMVVDGGSTWLYDAEHERWVYYDGTRLSTYAAGEGPSVHGDGADGVPAGGEEPAGPEPTQVVAAADGVQARAPYGAGGAGDVEATQVVGVEGRGQAHGPYGGGGGGASEATRVVDDVADPDPAARSGDA